MTVSSLNKQMAKVCGLHELLFIYFIYHEHAWKNPKKTPKKPPTIYENITEQCHYEIVKGHCRNYLN